MSSGVQQLAVRVDVVRRPLGSNVDWHSLARRAFILAVFVYALVELYIQARGTEYGLDFRGGTWQAGRALLEGRSPYPPPLVGEPLLHASSGFMTPPPLALIGIPFSLLPFWVAIALFNLACVGGAIWALRLLGVTDRRLYVLAACSFPFVSSLSMGQPDGLFALAAACAWKYRDHSWKGAFAAAILIAAKLLAWPLIIWLLVTRRSRQAAVAAGCTLAILLATWACIGFKGLVAYPRLLADDAKTYENVSHSLVAGFMHLGVTAGPAVVFSILLALLLGSAMIKTARGSDSGWFTAALVVGIMSSAIVWEHYFVLLFVCLAAMRRLHDRVFWLLLTVLWIAPVENPVTLWQAWLVPIIVTILAIRAATLSRSAAASPTLV